MSNAIWGDPKPTADEHYPLKLFKGLLQDMLRQVPADGACLALYDENINQMVVRLHIRLARPDEKDDEFSQRRNTGRLTEKSPSSPDAGNAGEPRFVHVMSSGPDALFPLGSAYMSGRDMIGATWRNNQPYHLSHEQYQTLRTNANQPPLNEKSPPGWYLTLPLREPEQLYEDIERKATPARMPGVIVLYQNTSGTGFQTQQRQCATLHAEKAGLYLQNDRLVRLQISTRNHIQQLKQISTTFPNSLKLLDLVESIHQFVTDTVDVSSMLLTLYDRDTKKLYDIFAMDKKRTVAGLSEHPVIANPDDRPLWSQITQKDKNTLLLSTDRNERSEWQFHAELLRGTWGDQADAKTFLLIPMKMFTRVVGSLCITSQRPQAYGQLEVLVLETMVQIITVALENARLYERPRLALKQSKQREQALAATVNGLQAISTVLNLRELLQKFVQIVVNLAQAEMGSFFQIVPDEDELVAQAIFDRTGNWNKADAASNNGKDEHDELIHMIHLPFKHSLLEDLIDEAFFYLDQSQIETLAQNCADSGKIFLRETHTQKMLVIPMRYQADLVGLVIIHTSIQQRLFQPEEIGILMAVSAQAAGAIRNAQLFEQIQEANAELQRMDKVKDEFIVTASHELRTPLSAISGYSSLLKRQSENGRINAQQVLKYAGKMVASTQQLKDLVDNMTVAARYGALDKKLELQLQPANLLAAAETAVNILNISIEQRINVDIAANLWVNSDEMRLRQVVTNLLENASKYSPPHGRILIAAHALPLSRLPEKEVDYSLVASGGDPEVILVRVYDEGEGIAPEDADKIFEKFVRATRSLTTPVRGTGLGLYICRRFTEAMGGRLWLERSIPGKGSIFSFYLLRMPEPIKRGEHDEPEPEPEEEEPTYSASESIGR